MSKVNSVTSEGQPDFVIKNIHLENKTNIKLKIQEYILVKKLMIMIVEQKLESLIILRVEINQIIIMR